MKKKSRYVIILKWLQRNSLTNSFLSIDHVSLKVMQRHGLPMTNGQMTHTWKKWQEKKLYIQKGKPITDLLTLQREQREFIWHTKNFWISSQKKTEHFITTTHLKMCPSRYKKMLSILLSWMLCSITKKQLFGRDLEPLPGLILMPWRIWCAFLKDIKTLLLCQLMRECICMQDTMDFQTTTLLLSLSHLIMRNGLYLNKLV